VINGALTRRWALPIDGAARLRPAPIKPAIRLGFEPRAEPLAIPSNWVGFWLAIFSLRVQLLSRSDGRSVIAAAAYRSGSSLADNRLGREFDFTNKRAGIAHTAILGPENAPAELLDRQTLWNAAEKADSRRDSVPAREILVALPHELTDEQRRDLVEDFVRESLVKRGMIADLAVHRPGDEGDERNHHAHILVTTRDVGLGGFGNKNRDWVKPELVTHIRREWADVANLYLERHAPHVEKISEKTLAAQGVERAPTQHQGPDCTAMERRGNRTERGETNRDIRAENIGREREARQLDKSVADSFDAKTWMARPSEQVVKEMEAGRDALDRRRDDWRRDRDAIQPPKPASIRGLEADLTREEAAAHKRAKAREEDVQDQGRTNGVSLKKIAFWQSNPAQAAMQQLRDWNADLDRILKARAEVDRTRKALETRRAWTKSGEGRDHIQNLRQPDLDAAKAAQTQRRTLDRKLARMDKRIVEADRAIFDVKVAQRLGHERLRVPASIPNTAGEGTANARRYFRFMSAEARVAVRAAPAPEREAALKFVKSLVPGAPVKAAPRASPSINPLLIPGRSGPAKGPDLPDL